MNPNTNKHLQLVGDNSVNNDPSTSQRKLYKEKEIANIYRVSRRTLQNLRQKDDGPDYHKQGRNIYYTLKDCDEYFLRSTKVKTSNLQKVKD